MKIAILGSAPSSIRLAPFNDPSWKIFGCSPGVYPVAPRVDEWFELHRWEPPVLGKADQQKPWFSPEYCGWMAQQKLVWMYDRVPEIQNSRRFPYDELVARFGSFFFTSSIAWMLAHAIMLIEEDRLRRKSPEEDCIGLWGVDMAANEEYADQRPGCQFFIQIAHSLDIKTMIPKESDLMAPPMYYGIHESNHMMIKLTERLRELTQRRNNAQVVINNTQAEMHFLAGAIDDVNYMIKTWLNHEEPYVADFKTIFNGSRDQPKLKVIEGG